MIQFPRTLAELRAAHGVVRAGGTDLALTRRIGLDGGDLVDLRDCEGLDAIAIEGDMLRIGARARIAAVASHPDVIARAPALAKAADALATPQIRAVATIAGDLLQRNRCAYFRSPEFACLKKGGSSCPARAGEHVRLACFDLGPCISVHPSTLAMALLLYDAQVETLAGFRTVQHLLGDGKDGTRDHQLAPGDLVLGLYVPLGPLGERAAYVRATGRAFAEWPLVEAGVRLTSIGGYDAVRIAVGGVAPVPLRLPRLEALLGTVERSTAAHDAQFARGLAGFLDDLPPVADNAWKVPLVLSTVHAALNLALEAA